MTAPPAGISPTFWRLLTEEPLARATVLDVGTGRGRIALALAPLACRVVGLDRDAEALAEATRLAAAAGLGNVEFVTADVEKIELADLARPDLVTAHLYFAEAFVERAARALSAGGALACVAFHVDQWKETGRRSRFAYDESQARALLGAHGFEVEHLEVEREVQRFASVEHALAASIGLEERWRSDGRWFNYLKFLEEGGRTLTRSHLILKARRR
jgi:ubiquinone/menaquinone biosynthesis C-methylase UbiE